MCGIAGILHRTEGESVPERSLRQMLGRLRHRGPDEFGILLDHELGLGSARLSVIDLDGGAQPIPNEDESLWIVFNGEIFNHPELRTELEPRGHRFRTRSDTEVALHLYEEYGPKGLNRMNGQFALAVWDARRRRLFLARDRLGVRPLFYAETGRGGLIFGSEIKAILAGRETRAELDPEILGQVFTFWAAPGPQTIFRGIRELPPGHYLTADAASVRIQPYWQLQFPADCERQQQPAPVDEVLEEFRSLLIDACRIRLRADVPVGAYLSGGLDSSMIAALVRGHLPNRLVTFSIAFNDEEFDESAFQRQMAAHLGTEHHVARATHEDIGAVFPEVIWHAETPLLRTGPAPMFLLAKLVHRTGFKVVLTGEGADELLAGYDIFKEDKIRRFWAREPGSRWRCRLFQRLYRDLPGVAQNNGEFLAAFFGEGLRETDSPWYSHAVRWSNNSRTRRFLAAAGESDPASRLISRLPRGFSNWEPLARAQFLEIITFLSPYLLSSQGDRMAMAHSVEGRFPFLDHRLVEFCGRLDPRLKLSALREKRLLRLAAQPWLPSAIAQRPKRPYRAPIHRSFFNPTCADYVNELLSPAGLRETGLFKPQAVAQLLAKLKAGLRCTPADEMALTGILSTQLIHHLFVKTFRAAPGVGGEDRVKVHRRRPAAKLQPALT